MVRRETLIGGLPFRIVSHLSPISPIAHPPSEVVFASSTGKPPPFHSERSVPHPESHPKKRLKRFYPGMTERGVAANSWTYLCHDISPCPPVLIRRKHHKRFHPGLTERDRPFSDSFPPDFFSPGSPSHEIRLKGWPVVNSWVTLGDYCLLPMGKEVDRVFEWRSSKVGVSVKERHSKH